MEQITTVTAYIANLEGLTDETVSREDVIATLKEIAARPANAKRRGQLSGVALEEMTLEQLKREKINASSVLYKAKQRGASEDTIAKNQARLDAVTARLNVLEPAKPEAPVEQTADTAAPEAEHPVEAEL